MHLDQSQHLIRLSYDIRLSYISQLSPQQRIPQALEMVPAEGFPNPGPLSYPDDISSSVTMNIPPIPLSNMITEGYGPNFMPFEYSIETPIIQQQSPQIRNRRSPPSQKSKTQPSPPGARNVGNDPRILTHNGQIHPSIHIDDFSKAITPELKLNSPKSRAKGRGRGKGHLEHDSTHPPKAGRGRASTQGIVLQIPHQGRVEALKEQALKRKRFEGDEPQDETADYILQDMLTKDTVEKGLSARRRKSEGKPSKREHHACDRCFRNKTKVSFLTPLVEIIDH